MAGHTLRIEILNNPAHSYFAGQILQGQLLFHVDKEKKTGGIKLKCVGRADVHFTEQHTVTTGTGSNRRTHTETRHYRTSENYFEFKVYLIGGENTAEQIILPGRHTYPFQFQIPSRLPSSFQGRYGKVQYWLEATVKRSWKFDYHASLPFTVNSLVDLNTWPGLTNPVILQKHKYICCLCCKSGPITFTFRMEKSGFVPGQPLDFFMEVDNKSTRNLSCMLIKLNQNIRFMAQGHSKSTNTTVMQINGPSIRAGETEVWRGTTKIPPLPPSNLGGCQIIDLTYTLEPKINIPDAIDLKGEFQVVIGTIPLREQFIYFQPQPTPTAPVLEPSSSGDMAPPAGAVQGYPDLPPPSYEIATKFDNNLPEYNEAVENEEGDGGNASGGLYPHFVPKYPTYGWK